ncbi:MAG: hypothetical protein R3C30_13555 [Hyphomonadaceae bacterium]
MTQADAARLAQFKRDSLAERMEQEFADIVNRLRATLDGADQPTDQARAELRRLAYELTCTAGTFNRGSLSTAARALCVLLDGLESRRAWDRNAINVNVDVIRALMRSPPGEETEDLLAALARLTAHVSRT